MYLHRILAAFLLGLASFAAAGAQPVTAPFDTVIANGRIVDGTGSPWYSGA
jgi:hypothetical protein